MRLLTFLVDRFGWTPFSKTLPGAAESPSADEVADAVVAFMHVEAADVTEERRSSVFKKTLKHLKWLANKQDLKSIALHSFTHLGGDSAAPDEALAFMRDLAERLERTGYAVKITPFGWFSAWTLDVRGESLAKVYRSF